MKAKVMICAAMLMVSCMASAQAYVNIEFKDGAVRSYSSEVTSRVTFGEKKEVGTINGHAYVELAGLKWATENVANLEKGLVAATYDPTYGFYYTQANDNAKQAAESWGGTWKLPTKEQWDELIFECYWVWTNDYNGKSGYIVYEAQAYEDKGKCNDIYTPSTPYSIDKVPHIFLPATGFYYSGSSDVIGQGGAGFYSSTGNEWYLNFSVGTRGTALIDPDYGLAVRPVSE